MTNKIIKACMKINLQVPISIVKGTSSPNDETQTFQYKLKNDEYKIKWFKGPWCINNFAIGLD
jgi:hypothetical protein